MAKKFLTYLLVVLACGASAQVDSTIFTYEEYMSYVRAYHPVLVQADLRVQQAEDAVMQSRGQLDPKLYSNFDEKDFDSKIYFDVWESGLKIPTWFGADFMIGYKSNQGDFLNPERNIPEVGQLAIGASMPLLRNLVYNDRRAAITQARVMQQSTEEMRRLMINDLFFEATQVYWNWVNTHAAWRINAESVKAAQVRFEAVRTSFFRGDKPAIDTVESLIQLQIRMFNTQEAYLDYINAGLALSNYLWYENQTPLELQETTFPPMPNKVELPAIVQDSLNTFIQRAAPLHPEVNQINLFITNLDVQRRLSANNLLPELTVDYNLLSSQLNTFDSYANSLDWANYQVGLTFSIPLFLRKERGYLNQVKAKIDETASKRDQKVRQIENKILASSNKLDNLAQQINLFSQTYQNYETLYNAELRRFQIGESTLFLVNRREIKAIEARLKLAELLVKYQVAYQEIWFSGGALQ
jgi:outer membrane protein TolC